MYQGIKAFIEDYKESFDSNRSATNKAKARLKDRGAKADAKSVENEKALILAEWQQKETWGTNAHNLVQDREMILYPNSVKDEYIYSEGNTIPEETNKLERDKHYFSKKMVDNQNKLIGYADEVFVDKKGFIHVTESKTFGELRRNYTVIAPNGFKVIKNFFTPISHLVDCNFNFAALQASLYLYTFWNNNKKFKPGKIFIRHIKLDEEGNIVSEEMFEAPYLLSEVKNMLLDSKKKKW